jgi:hypothetical protein
MPELLCEGPAKEPYAFQHTDAGAVASHLFKFWGYQNAEIDVSQYGMPAANNAIKEAASTNGTLRNAPDFIRHLMQTYRPPPPDLADRSIVPAYDQTSGESEFVQRFVREYYEDGGTVQLAYVIDGGRKLDPDGPWAGRGC